VWHSERTRGPAAKVAAIKAYQDATGVGLAEARRVVEANIEERWGAADPGGVEGSAAQRAAAHHVASRSFRSCRGAAAEVVRATTKGP
jgi:hypothetical protein